MKLNNSEESVYRMVHYSQRERRKGKEPRLDAFKPTPADDSKLSVDYEPKTTPEESLARFGATISISSGEFKNPHDYSVYSLNIGFLRSFTCIIDIYLDEVLVSPPERGRPDNPAHSLVEFDEIAEEDEPDILYRIQQHAIMRKVEANPAQVDELTMRYRRIWD